MPRHEIVAGEQVAHVRKMRLLLSRADVSGDGYIQREEMHKLMEVQDYRDWLNAMDVEVEDAHILFEEPTCN